MDFHIRQASTAEIDIVAPLFDQYRQFYHQPSDLEGAKAFLAERVANEQSVIFVAVAEPTNGRRSLGFTQLYPSFSSVRMRRSWVLNDLFVAPDARGMGVARALMDRARKFAADNGIASLSLATAIDNRPAQALYESLGWVRDEKFYHYDLAV